MYNYKNTGHGVAIFYWKIFLLILQAKYGSSQILVVLGTTLDDKLNNNHYIHLTTDFLVSMTRVHNCDEDKTGNKTGKTLIIFLVTCSHIVY